MHARIAWFLTIPLLALSARVADLQKLSEEMSHFYLHPSHDRYQHIQSEADQLADSLHGTGNTDLLAAAFIAAAAQKHHWDIDGNGKISALARQITQGQSRISKYVSDDSVVDVGKLDVWWADFFATGENKYLGKILQRAKHPQPGEHAADFMMPAMAAWSFKSNCSQHKAVMSFAKQCVESNAFPTKKEFLKECIASADRHSIKNR